MTPGSRVARPRFARPRFAWARLARTRLAIALVATITAASGCGSAFGREPAIGMTPSGQASPAGARGEGDETDEREARARCEADVRLRASRARSDAASAAFEAQFADTDPSALAEFHDVLAPHGVWRDDPSLGTVWVPSREAVGDAFVPYVTAGRWTFDAELVWVSDYAWGWAPFHYGRWARTSDRAWAWIPGRKYAGAWVDWRTGDDPGFAHVGWGATPPSFVWLDGEAVRVPRTPAAAFVYCRRDELFAADLAAHLTAMPEVLAIAARTRPFTRSVAWEASRAHLPFASTLAPHPDELGIARAAVVPPPAMDPGLQRAWMLARPSTAETVGVRPRLATPPRLKTWVAGAPKYVLPRKANDVAR